MFEYFPAGVFHGPDRGADHLVGPDDQADPGFPEYVHGRAVVLGRDDDQGTGTVPRFGKGKDLVRARLPAVDQDGVRACFAIGRSPLQGLIHAPARDQRLHPRDNAEVRVPLAVLAGPDLAAELVDVCQGLFTAVDEAVGLGELLVFDTHAGYPPLFEFPHQAPHVVEVAVTGVAVQQDRDIRGVGHEFQHVHHLGPACLVAVPHAELRRQGEAARPDALEPGLLHEFRRDAVMGFQEELQLGRFEQVPQLSAFALFRVHFRMLFSYISAARATSAGKSISIQARPVMSSTRNNPGVSLSRSRMASS